MTKLHIAHGKDLRNGRFSQTGQIYLVTAVTHNRVPFFKDLYISRCLVKAIMGAQPAAKTLSFVIMPDHMHWLMQLETSTDLSSVVKGVKSVSARAINRLLKRKGRIWQAGFHDRAMRMDDNIKEAARYIVANPLRAGLCSDIGEYSFWDAAWV